MIGIVDYGSGNTNAISNIYKKQNIPHLIISNPQSLRSASKLILPGVGAFDETIKLLEKTGFRTELDEAVLERKVPVLGVCVGMQIMATSSDEGKLPGLNWIPGHVRKFDASAIPFHAKLPHMGWNSVSPMVESVVFSGVNYAKGFYFLHSYYYDCDSPKFILAQAEYGREFACAINNDHIYGFQFHPEKSHSNGISLFSNFASL